MLGNKRSIGKLFRDFVNKISGKALEETPKKDQDYSSSYEERELTERELSKVTAEVPYTKQQIADLYTEVTPSEYATPNFDSIEPTPTPMPAHAYSGSELNLLRTRAMEAYRLKQESNPELFLSPGERLVVLSLYSNETGSPKVTWATASPTENGVSLKESITEQHMFDVISPDGSPIDLNRVGEYPISNVSDFMSRFTLLSSREVQYTNVKQEKFK